MLSNLQVVPSHIWIIGVFSLIQLIYVVARVLSSNIRLDYRRQQGPSDTVNFLLCGVQSSTVELFARHQSCLKGDKVYLDYGRLGFRGSRAELRGLAKTIVSVIRESKVGGYEKVNFYGVSLGAKVFTEVIGRMPKQMQKKVTFHVINGVIAPEDVKNPLKALGRPLEILSWLWPIDLIGTIALRIGHHFGAKADTARFCQTRADKHFKSKLDKWANRTMTFGKFAGQVRFLNQRPKVKPSSSVTIINYLSLHDNEVDIEAQCKSIQEYCETYEDNPAATCEHRLNTGHATLYLNIWENCLTQETPAT